MVEPSGSSGFTGSRQIRISNYLSNESSDSPPKTGIFDSGDLIVSGIISTFP